MTSLRLITPGTAPQTAIPALRIPRQRLLTENSSITIQLAADDLRAELLALRVTRTASFTTEFRGYRHDGLNE